MNPIIKTPEPVLEAIWTLWSRMGRQPRMRMVTGSMQPLIQIGDQLLIEPLPKNIHRGDVVIYRHREQLIAHRLVSIEGERLILKGDNVYHFDPPLPREKIIGRVLGIEGGADYTAMRWRLLNSLIAQFSNSISRAYRLYQTLKHCV